MFIAKGYVSLSEAVVRLAERWAPAAAVRKYLEREDAAWSAIMTSWPANVPFGWSPTPDTPPANPAWGALAAARDELRRTFEDADLICFSLSRKTGDIAPIQPERWRTDAGLAAFQRGLIEGDIVLLREADLARWLADDTPAVATETISPMAAASADGWQYPALGAPPEHQHLTACEVLTWIGYCRAISKEVYFAPFVNALGLSMEERTSLLHRSIPEPKPAEGPMDDAERKLMGALRAGHVHILMERNGSLEEAPSEIYEYAVVVNARGSLEADANASKRDHMRALSYLSGLPPIGDVWFRKSEVLKAWPNTVPEPTVEDGERAHGPPVVPEAIAASANETHSASQQAANTTVSAEDCPRPEPQAKEPPHTNKGDTEAMPKRDWDAYVEEVNSGLPPEDTKALSTRIDNALLAFGKPLFEDANPSREQLYATFIDTFGKVKGINEKNLRIIRKEFAGEAMNGGLPTHQRN